MKKFQFCISMATTLFLQNTFAANIKQLLNDQSLAVLELGKSEITSIGENFIVNNNNKQCLLEVLTVQGKFVTVSSKSCLDKEMLRIGFKVEKSLISLELIGKNNQGFKSNLDLDKNNNLENEKSNTTDSTTSKKYSLAPNFLNFYPDKGQFYGATLYASPKSYLRNTKNNSSIDSTYSYLGQFFGAGLGSNLSAGISLFNTTGGQYNSVDQRLVLEATYNKNNPNTDQVYQFGLFICPQSGSDNNTRSNFYGISIFSGKTNDEYGYTAGVSLISYGESSTTRSQTSIIYKVAYQKYYLSGLLLELGASFQEFSDEVSKNTNLTIRYNTIPSGQIGVGGFSSNKSFSWLIGWNYFSTVVLAKSTVDTNLNYSGNTLSFNVGYFF